jgi:hypothetical protein
VRIRLSRKKGVEIRFVTKDGDVNHEREDKERGLIRIKNKVRGNRGK